MATYKYTAKNNGYTATLSLTPSTQNIAENTTLVEYKLELTAGVAYFQYWPIGWEIWLGGSQTAYQAKSGAPQKSIAAYGTITLCSGSTTIAHNADGTKNMSISFRVDGGTAASYLPGTIRYTGGESLELPAIPRISELSLSVSSVTLDGSDKSVTVTITPHSESFSHKLRYIFGSAASEEISLSAGETTAELTFPMSLLNEIPRSVNGVATVTLTTYNGETAIGTARTSLTITAGKSVVPTITAVMVTREGQNALDMFIKGYDRARLKTTAEGAYGSSIASYEITGGLSGASVLTGVLWTVGENTWTVKVTDTRGRTATEKVSITVVDYATPAISGAAFERCTANGTPDDDGTFLRVSAEISISSCNGENSYTAKVLYKLQTEEEWTQAGAFTGTSALYDIGLTDAAYDVCLVATDALSEGVAQATLDVGDVIMEYDPVARRLEFLAEYVKIAGKLEIDAASVSEFVCAALSADSAVVNGALNADCIQAQTLELGGKASLGALEVAGGGELAAYITESKHGTQDKVWYYRKYSDGSCELCMTVPVNAMPVSTAYGALYSSIELCAPPDAGDDPYLYPFPVYCPNVTFSFVPSGDYTADLWAYAGGTDERCPTFRLVRQSAASSVSGTISICVHGSLFDSGSVWRIVFNGQKVENVTVNGEPVTKIQIMEDK